MGSHRPGGGSSGASLQRKDEPKGEWDQQQKLAKDTFFDLIRQNLLAADAWKTRAEVERARQVRASLISEVLERGRALPGGSQAEARRGLAGQGAA